MNWASAVNAPSAKGFRELLSVVIRSGRGQESVDNEMPLC